MSNVLIKNMPPEIMEKVIIKTVDFITSIENILEEEELEMNAVPLVVSVLMHSMKELAEPEVFEEYITAIYTTFMTNNGVKH